MERATMTMAVTVFGGDGIDVAHEVASHYEFNTSVFRKCIEDALVEGH